LPEIGDHERRKTRRRSHRDRLLMEDRYRPCHSAFVDTRDADREHPARAPRRDTQARRRLGRLLPGNQDRRCPSALVALRTDYRVHVSWQFAVTNYVRLICRKPNTLNVPGIAGPPGSELSQDVRLAEMIGSRTASAAMQNAPSAQVRSAAFCVADPRDMFVAQQLKGDSNDR
jgi:hypothetical protein